MVHALPVTGLVQPRLELELLTTPPEPPPEGTFFWERRHSREGPVLAELGVAEVLSGLVTSRF